MNTFDLQQRLKVLGHYAGKIDGDFGPQSKKAFRSALTFPVARLTQADLAAAAAPYGLTAAHVGAVVDVEASGQGQDPATGLPIIRYEGHQFRQRTGSKFDDTHPDLSFPYSERKAYPQPAAQLPRWTILEQAVALDPGAALESTSWGLGQVMGFNYEAAGHGDVWGFARAMASGEREQVLAIMGFLKANGLIEHLKAKRWDKLAAGYNGPSFRDFDYDGRLAKAYARRGGV